ncbi:MAG: hypothetical protein WBL25_03605 [Anaerolineales bacterium]
MKRYSKQGLWSLFLVCAFPLHVWTIILAFRDFSWVTERTNSWDAIGVVSYGLIFAFIESVVVFLVATLLGFLVSKKWNEDRRISLMGILVLITSLWAIINYLYFMLNVSVPGGTILFMAGLAHPLRFIYTVSLVLVGLSVVMPVYFVLRSEKFLKGIQGLFERLSLLTLFYLFFDFVGLVIVIVRNV